MFEIGVFKLNKVDHGNLPVVALVKYFFIFDKLELVSETIADDDLALVINELGVVVNEDVVAGVVPLDCKEDGD